MQRAQTGSRTSGEHAPEPLRILLVDDDENLRFMLTLLLDDPRVDAFYEAGDGAEALSIATRENPNVIVCDCSMPGMSGDEAGSKLRAALPNALIVSYSGLDANKPWADEAITKASGNDIEHLKDTVLGPRTGAEPAA
jgi:CheY-like chemotaxis protein